MAPGLTRSGLLSLRYGDDAATIRSAIGSPLRAELRNEDWTDDSHKGADVILVYATQGLGLVEGVAVYVHLKSGKLTGVYAKEDDEWFYVVDAQGSHVRTASKLSLLPEAADKGGVETRPR